MKKLILLLLLPSLVTCSFAQNKEEAEKMIEEGVAYHDKGDYEGAINKYNKALELDKDNLYALAEKAYSLYALERFNETINICRKAIEMHPSETGLASVYVTYGNALDAQKKTDRSLAVYEEGISKFPDYYQLYYNQGITLSSVKSTEKALVSFEKAVMINPKHASSHNAIGALQYEQSKDIQALLAYCRFLVVEPQTKRAAGILQKVNTIVKGSAKQTGKNSISINIDSIDLGDTTEDGKNKANNFSTTQLIMNMSGALDLDKKNKKKTEVEQFLSKFEMVCSSLKELQKNNHGFYWEYYVPYFVEMKEKNLLETFSYIAFASSDDEGVNKWLKKHGAEIDAFYEWSGNFKWK